MSKPTGTARPFIVFTAEDFYGLCPDSGLAACFAGKHASCCPAPDLARLANAILNERGTRVYGPNYHSLAATGEHLYKSWNDVPTEGDHEALLFGPREIE